MNKVLIWDFDGTLGYRQGNWEEAIFALTVDKIIKTKENFDLVSEMLQTGFPWHKPQKSYVTINNKYEWWDYVKPRFIKIFTKLGYNKYEATLKAEMIPEQYAKPEQWKLYDDTLPSLLQIKMSSWKNVLVTNNVPEFPDIFKHLKLENYFEEVFVSSLIGFNKPNPLIINGYLRGRPVDTKIVVIGDREDSDLALANAIKVECILVRRMTNCRVKWFGSLNDLTKYLLCFNPE